MLLQELTGVKKFYSISTEGLLRLLARQGIKMIGAGKYGQVFTHDSWDYVVKIFRHDPHYMRFINYAINHPNEHFPKIVKRPMQMRLFHKRYEGDNRMWVVKIEKLKPVNDSMGYFLSKTVAEVAYYIETKNPDIDRKWRAVDFPDGSTKRDVSYSDLLDEFPWFASLVDAWLEISRNAMDEDDWMDVNENNFMERDDGTIVLIDPLWAGLDAWHLEEKTIMFNAAIGVQKRKVSGPDYLLKKEKEKELTSAAAKELADELADVPF